MNIYKTSFISLIVTVIKLTCALVINKIYALYFGTIGFALLGQIQNLTQIGTTLAQGGFSNGIIRNYSAQNRNDLMRQAVITTSLYASIVACGLTSITIFFASNFLGNLLFASVEYNGVIKLFSFTIFAFVFVNIIISVLLGARSIFEWAFFTGIQALLGLIITLLLVFYLGLFGAILGVVISPAVAGLLAVLLMYPKLDIQRFSNLSIRNFDRSILLNLLGFSFMTLISSTSVPIGFIIIRNHISMVSGQEAAGVWQGMIYVSTAFFMVISISMTTYILPKFSSIDSSTELKKELFTTLKLLIPVVVFGVAAFYSAREIIVLLLFSKDFSTMSQLFMFFSIGLLIKAISWVFGNVLIALANVKLYIFCEVMFFVYLVGWNYFFINKFGLYGTSLAFACSYVFYIATVFFAMKYAISRMDPARPVEHE